jgi:hypothetical protein
MSMRKRRRLRARATVGRPVFPWAYDDATGYFSSANIGLALRFGDAFGLEYLGVMR